MLMTSRLHNKLFYKINKHLQILNKLFCDLVFIRMMLWIFFCNWSRICLLLHWNSFILISECFYFCIVDCYSFILIYYSTILWFVIYNLCSLILYYDLAFLNVFLLMFFLVNLFSMFLLAFIGAFYFNLFGHLLVGDNFMDVLFIRTLLCLLECFSLLCRCLALFLRLFCNLLSSHFLLILFFEFIYFVIILFIFFNFIVYCCFFCLFLGGGLFFLILIGFYLFLFTLDIFSSLLQIFILINMLHLCVVDWCIFLSC